MSATEEVVGTGTPPAEAGDTQISRALLMVAAVVVLVSATTLLFSIWPARRAAHVNPILALHAEG